MSTTIEIYTRRIRNETAEDLALLEKSIERCQGTIQRLKVTKSGFNPRVVIERNEGELKRMLSEREVLERKLDDIDQGLYTEKLQAELDHNRQVIDQKAASTKKRKEQAKATTTPTAAATKPSGNAPRPSGNAPRSGGYYHPAMRNNERDFDYAEKQFFRDCGSVPDHLREKLKNMPNNMGYIWKDIWCFGERHPEQTHEYTLFEKRNQQFLVHVYNLRTRMYTLYEKDNTGRRKFIERAPMTRRTNYVGIAQLIGDL
jgi:hypothetical protein